MHVFGPTFLDFNNTEVIDNIPSYAWILQYEIKKLVKSQVKISSTSHGITTDETCHILSLVLVNQQIFKFFGAGLFLFFEKNNALIRAA